MTCRCRQAKHAVVRAAKALWSFGGPVAGGIAGQMGREEWQRAAAKTFASWVTAKVTLRATMQEPEFWTDLLCPLIFAGLTALNEVAFHTQSGKPADDTPQPPPESPQP